MRNRKLFTGIFIAAIILCGCVYSMSSMKKITGITNPSISLAGTWRFQTDPEKIGEKEKWFARELGDTVQLPGTMDENQKGKPVVSFSARHLNRLYKYEGIAWYQKKVTIPQSWKKKRITLFIERAHWSTKVWVDNHPVPGVQESLSVPHRHDLTDFLTPGEHTITVAVDNTVRFHLGGHSYSDETQTNWNGMTGRLELQATGRITIAGIQVYPNAAEKTVRADVRIVNLLKTEQACKVELKFEKQHTSQRIRAAPGQTEVTFNLNLPENTTLWDDFSPDLHSLTIQLATKNQLPQTKTLYTGIRNVSTDGPRLLLNGVSVFLRGNVENCEFPLTGYPSCETADWKHMFCVFQEYGLNHVRFHSYTPPEAAFIAADELGMILQTELPFWGLTGVNEEMDAYLARELDRILDEYGNHPSFVLMAMGNELNVRAGEMDVVEEWVKHAQQKDPRHLYTASTSLFDRYRPTDQFLISTRIRQICGAGTDWDHEEEVKKFYHAETAPAPLISHELGQWAVYPDFSEIPKYTGVLRAENFSMFKKSLEANHMGDQAADFVKASGKLSALLYRQEMEAVYRTPNTSGFQLLQLHDFPGQGTATVGILNVFRESKGLITPEEWKHSCDAAIPLLRFEKRTWKSSETFTGKAQFIHYNRDPLKGVKSKWEIVTDAGKKTASGIFPRMDLPNAQLIDLGRIKADLSSIKTAQRLTVRITVAGRITNDWNIWVFPKITENTGDVLITRDWNETTKKALNAGQSVLFIPQLQAGRGTLPVQFLPPFWSPLFKPDQSSTMGLLLNPDHPVFNGFPTDFHTDWQWFDILVTKKLPQSTAWMWSGFDTYGLILDDLPPDYRPLVQPIDHFYRNKRLGLVLEGTYGKGKLMICCADLEKDTNRRIAVPQFKQSLLNYMNSNRFNPTQKFTDDMFKHWFDFSEDDQGLKIKFVSSQHPNPNLHAENVIDGNPYTYWMNDNKPGITYPHEIHFELPKPVVVKGFRYTPRQDFEELGLIKKYEFYVSDHAYHWYSPVAKGEFKPGHETQVIMLNKPKAGRNFRFVALESYDGDRMATMAEFELITEPLTEFEYVP